MSFSLHLSVCSVVPGYLMMCCDFGSTSPIYPYKKCTYASTLRSLPVVNIMTDSFVQCLMELSYVSSDLSDLFIVILCIHFISLLPP